MDAHENELIRTEEQAARDKCPLTLHDNGDGTTTGHFTVPALAAAMLGKVIDAMTAPRRMREPTGRDRPVLRLAHRRGLAFAELLEHLPTDHLHPKTAATVVVTIDHTVLPAPSRQPTSTPATTLSAGEARRLACNAGILPAVLGTKSVALDLGRETRLFSESQRLAKGLEHDTCAATGCERPYAWCELHHRQPWAKGGKTDLANAIPLCHQHHQWIHDTGFNHQPCPTAASDSAGAREGHHLPCLEFSAWPLTPASIEIPRPDSGDVVELILEDHRLFEHLLRELRNEQNDRDALRHQVAELLVAHGEAEESKVYPQLERKDAIDEEEAEHGEKEHQEGYEKLLPLLEATELYDEEFSHHLHEFSETLLHHLDEEERDILNPAREDVSEEDRAKLGAAWAAERNRMLDDGCASTEQVRALVDGS